MASQILELAAGPPKNLARKQVTDPQIVEMVWRHSQCIHPRCPLLVFGGQLAQEVNEFFREDE